MHFPLIILGKFAAFDNLIFDLTGFSPLVTWNSRYFPSKSNEIPGECGFESQCWRGFFLGGGVIYIKTPSKVNLEISNKRNKKSSFCPFFWASSRHFPGLQKKKTKFKVFSVFQVGWEPCLRAYTWVGWHLCVHICLYFLCTSIMSHTVYWCQIKIHTYIHQY